MRDGKNGSKGRTRTRFPLPNYLSQTIKNTAILLTKRKHRRPNSFDLPSQTVEITLARPRRESSLLLDYLHRLVQCLRQLFLTHFLTHLFSVAESESHSPASPVPAKAPSPAQRNSLARPARSTIFRAARTPSPPRPARPPLPDASARSTSPPRGCRSSTLGL